MDITTPVSTKLSSIFDDFAATADAARKRADAHQDSAESRGDRESREAPDRRVELDASVELVRAAVLRDGARALEKLDREPGAELTPDELTGLEAIVLVEGRPALLVEHGDFPQDLPGMWTTLSDHRSQIRTSLARVGRVEVTGHPELAWIGTGFLVADDVVMTNRHVALEFAKRDGAAWTFMSGRSADVDLLEEHRSTQELEFDVVEVLGVHDADDVDLALLRVAPTAAAGQAALPSPLPVSTHALEGDSPVVYVVGYPAWDGRRNEPATMSRIFEDVYNVKRLQPGTGQFTAGEAVLRHDCSTLGGNSGSPVFDLATDQVVGLHFGGRYGVGNYAVPLWQLVEDPLVAGAGVNFQDGVPPQPGEELRPWPAVRRGDTQHPVRTLQYLMRARGRFLSVDGVFGVLTEGAVRAVQSEERLAATGVVDAGTWERLVVELARGARGNAVSALQEEFQFRREGHPPQALAVDGVFGERTEAAVRAFQEALGREVEGVAADGVVGRTTWQALVSGMLAA